MIGKSTVGVTAAIITVPIDITSVRVVVAIASTRITTGHILRHAMPIPIAVVAEDRRLGGTWRSALRITIAVVTVRILLTGIWVVVAIATGGAWTGLRIRVAIRSITIVTDLLTHRTLVRIVEIAEITGKVADQVRAALCVICARDTTLLLGYAGLTGVITCVIHVAGLTVGLGT